LFGSDGLDFVEPPNMGASRLIPGFESGIHFANPTPEGTACLDY
jgi:hypothetical protein